MRSVRGGETLEFARDADKLVLKMPAEHTKLDDYKVEDVGRALETLTLTDVKQAAQEPGDKVGESVFTTTDGTAVTVTGYKVGTGDKAEFWAQFAVASADVKDAHAKADADALAKRVGGWAYQLGSWKEAALLPSLDLIKASDPAPAATPQPGMPTVLAPGAAADPAPASTAVPTPAKE